MNDLLSDNSSGLTPEALHALTAAASGPADAYGADDATARATARVRELLGEDVEVAFVATGTAANTLTFAALTERWETVVCEEYAHLAVDEATGPEIVGGGTRVVTVPCEGRKLTPDALAARDATIPRGVHHPAPGIVTVSNPTEHGEVFTPDELADLAAAAHGLGYRFHVDGARFANAVAALDVDPRALSRDVGLDALTFGGAKNGLAMGEAIVLFPGAHQATAAARLPHLRKATGHLLSKHRFLTAPFAAALEDGAWLRHAAHANALAAKLGDGLTEAGLAPRFPVEANLVFVPLPDHVRDGLRDRGWRFHMPGHPDWRVARFVTSFATDPALVDRLVTDAAALV